MKRNVWILNHYAADMYFAKGGRHYWFAKYLKRDNYEPIVFCCNTKQSTPEKYIQTNELYVEKEADEIGVSFIFVNARTYCGNGKQRVLNMIDFYRNVQRAAKEYASKHGGPDIILASSVHPLTLIAGLQLAKYYKVKCICEIRDLWPEAIIAYSNKIKKNGLLAKLLYQGEKWIYKKADALIFTMEGGPDYLKDRHYDKEHKGPINMNKVHHICNGVDLEGFEYNKTHFQLDDDDINDANHYKIVYAGSIRRANNVGILLKVAKIMNDPSIRILIYGDGDELNQLKEMVDKENIPSIVFKGRINKQYIPSVVSKADINLVHGEMPYSKSYGESLNKVFEYLAAGRPILYTFKPNYSIAEKYQCGKITDGCSPKDIAKGIYDMRNLTEEEKLKMCENAKKAAADYDFATLTQKLEKIIEEM